MVRSWPAVIPAGRGYVTDILPRAVMDNHDYRPVLDGLDDDVIIAEWDIAFGLEDIERFAAACEAEPGKARVAPYRLYPASTGLASPVWAHRDIDGTWISDGEPACDLFGFGLVYLPLAIVRQHLTDTHGAVSDDTFSRWHHRRYGPTAVQWDVRLTHLHY